VTVDDKEQQNLQPGDPWTSYPPTAEDIKRIKDNRALEKLYAGEFESVLERLDKYRVCYPNAPIIRTNFFQVMSQEFSKLLFSEDMTVTISNNQDVMDELIETTALQSKLMQLSDITSSIGGCPIKTWRDAGGNVHIDLVPNNIYFPYHDPDDCTALTGQSIAWERLDTDTKQKYLVRETHTPGNVRREVLNAEFALDEEQYRKWYPGIPQDTATGYDGMLVEYIPNFRYASSFWGISDYNAIRDTVEEIMIRISMIADILDKHARPKQVLPSELLGQIQEMLERYRNDMARTGLISRTEADAMTRSGDLPRNLDAVYVPSTEDNGNLPRMVTWDANMVGAMDELDRLFDIFLSLSSMTPEVFGISKYGVSESGRALKFRNQRALATCNRKRQFMLPGLKNIIRAALYLAGVKVELREIGFVMQDGLPFDELEAAQISTMWLSAGIATPVSAMLNARPDITREQAEDEAAEIEANRMPDFDLNEAMPNTSSRGVNPDGGNSEENTQAAGGASGEGRA